MSGAQEQKSAIGRYRLLRELRARSHRAFAGVRSDDRNALVVIHRFVRDARLEEQRISPEMVALLLRDARCLAKNWHPNIARVRHVDLAGDTLYIATDFIDGVTLEDLLGLAKTRPSTPEEPLLSHAALARIFLDVLSGLQALHGLRDGIQAPLNTIHGELCPANVVIGKDGVARIVNVFRPHPTKVGSNSEALGYASPEALTGDVEQDGRADLYAVGVMLWETLMGRRLYADTDPARIAQRQREEDAPRPSAPLAEVAMKAISFDPALRYRSAQEMIANIRMLTGTIAPGSAVAQVVVDLAGERIRTRRAELHAWGSGQRRAVEATPQSTSSGSLRRVSVPPSRVIERAVAEAEDTPTAPAPTPVRKVTLRTVRVPADSEPDLETAYAPRPTPPPPTRDAPRTAVPTPSRTAPKHALPSPPATRGCPTPPSTVPDASAYGDDDDDDLPGPRSSTPEDDYLFAPAAETERSVLGSSAAAEGEASDDAINRVESADALEEEDEAAAVLSAAREVVLSPSEIAPASAVTAPLPAPSSPTPTATRPALEDVAHSPGPPSMGSGWRASLGKVATQLVTSSDALDRKGQLLPIVGGVAALSIAILLAATAIVSTCNAAGGEPTHTDWSSPQPSSTAVIDPAPADPLPAGSEVPSKPASSGSGIPTPK